MRGCGGIVADSFKNARRSCGAFEIKRAGARTDEKLVAAGEYRRDDRSNWTRGGAQRGGSARRAGRSVKILLYSTYFLPVVGGVQTCVMLLAKGLSELDG